MLYARADTQRAMNSAAAQQDDIKTDCRQRHPNGQQELLDQLKRHFNLGDALDSTEQCAVGKPLPPRVLAVHGDTPISITCSGQHAVGAPPPLTLRRH